EIAIGVLLQTLQRHGTSRGIADQALQLIAPMGGDLGVGVQGTEVRRPPRPQERHRGARHETPRLLTRPTAVYGAPACLRRRPRARPPCPSGAPASGRMAPARWH